MTGICSMISDGIPRMIGKLLNALSTLGVK